MIRVLQLQRHGGPPRVLPAEADVPEPDGRTWIDVADPSDEDLERLARRFGLHPLEVEDVRTFSDLPKLEEHGGHAFLVVHVLALEPDLRVRADELDLFWGRDFALTVHRGRVRAVEEAWRAAEHGRLPGDDPEFVVYAVLDRVAGDLVEVLDRLEEARERLEERLFQSPEAEGHAQEVLGLRRQLYRVRHALGPLRLLVARLARGDAPFVGEAARPYFRDVADLLERLHGMLEQELDLLADTYDAYLSSTSAALARAAQRTNEVVQRLTVVTSIFLPLSFIAGVYGMNFRHMPELQWTYGYPFALGLMAATAAAMLAYFRRRGWL